MNIFMLDKCPMLAAQAQHDKHVVKMALETAQLLCTAHHKLGSHAPWMMKPINNPGHGSAVWARASVANYNWLHQHGMFLCHEYRHRYHHDRDLLYMMRRLAAVPMRIPPIAMTEMYLAMPDAYKCDDPVQSYRNYYANEKLMWYSPTRGQWYKNKWTNRARPAWLERSVVLSDALTT